VCVCVCVWSRDSSVSIVTSLWVGRPGFDSRQGIFLFATKSRPALGPHIQWLQGVLYPGVKRPGREADHPPPSSAGLKNAWSDTSTPPTGHHGVVRSLPQQIKLYTVFHKSFPS
jgi:hypothetical protein